MCKRILLASSFALLVTITPLVAQQDSEHVRVYGKLLNRKDSTKVQNATILYEKLPYYDDMGTVRSSLDGDYEFYLKEGEEYSFRVDGLVGFETFETKLVISGGESMNQDFYLPPVEKEELITLKDLTFRPSSARILESSYPSLNEFIVYINERPDVLIQLEGHTDIQGNPTANMALSQARVDAVKDYLSENGVKAKRITTKAFGGSQPLTTERTDEAKRMNRRVEVRLIRP
jgi:outer membrane protein OmpA-like peptidoglycan-associated protein